MERRENNIDRRENSDIQLSETLYLWPLATARFAAASLRWWSEAWLGPADDDRPDTRTEWTTANEVSLQLASMQLRDFSTGPEGQPVLICAPFALHRAAIADFAPGHSIVEALRGNGVARIYLTDWRSATETMRYFSIDSYLADLNVAIDEIGAPVDLVGLCQGGWLSLVYAARFPDKVRRLVLVGAPVDISAGSNLSRLVETMPSAGFEEIVRRGNGIVSGRNMVQLWTRALAPRDPDEELRNALTCEPAELDRLRDRFQSWDDDPVDLPGAYYLEVVNWIFRENRIAAGHFRALGRTVNLADVRTPLFILTASDDEVVPAAQTLATARLVGTRASEIETASEDGTHLGLLMGRTALRNSWPRIAHWLASETVPVARAARRQAAAP